jgi:hypothetical protein
MTTASTDVLMITYDGSNVRWWVNGVLKRTVARAIGNPLYLTSSFYTSSSIAGNVVFGPTAGGSVRADGGDWLQAKCQIDLVANSTSQQTTGSSHNIASVIRDNPTGDVIVTFTNAVSSSTGQPSIQYDDGTSPGTNTSAGVNSGVATIVSFATTNIRFWCGPYNTDFSVYFAIL